MGIEIWMIGKTRAKYLSEGISEYEKRTLRYFKILSRVISDPKNAAKLSPSELKKQEAALILEKIEDRDFLILLDERGVSMNSVKFAAFLEEHIQRPGLTIFLVGGAYGFDQSIYTRSNLKLSLSEMTFSHQLIRLVLWEQVYRAVSIIKGLPYHNE